MQPPGQYSAVFFLLAHGEDEVQEPVTFDPGRSELVGLASEDLHILLLFIKAQVDGGFQEFELPSSDLLTLELQSHDILKGPVLEHATDASEDFGSFTLLEVNLGSSDALLLLDPFLFGFVPDAFGLNLLLPSLLFGLF